MSVSSERHRQSGVYKTAQVSKQQQVKPNPKPSHLDQQSGALPAVLQCVRHRTDAAMPNNGD